MKKLGSWIWRMFARSPFQNKVGEAVLDDPHVAAKFYPYLPQARSYVVEPVGTKAQPGALPIPPRKFWLGYAQTEQGYLDTGCRHVTNMREILKRAGTPIESFDRILDFGSASGIMIRWLVESAQKGEVWGVDIDGEHVLWCQRNLSPPFKFATTTSFPHLPFEDGYFGLVYAGSVFTHIADLAEAWLLELRRIVRPGGRLYLTVQDEHSLELYMREPGFRLGERLRAHDQKAHITSRSWDFFLLDRMPGAGSEGQAQVFYRRDYLRRHWGNYLKVVSVTPESYWHQTGLLLEK